MCRWIPVRPGAAADGIAGGRGYAGYPDFARSGDTRVSARVSGAHGLQRANRASRESCRSVGLPPSDEERESCRERSENEGEQERHEDVAKSVH